MHGKAEAWPGLLLCAALLTALFLSGCASYGSFLRDTAQYLNEREVKSCLRINATGGGGFGATLNGSLTGFITTGGMDPKYCMSPFAGPEI